MKPNSGNVLFIILIAVALFAALSYAVTSSSRSGSGNVNKDKLEIQATSIIGFINSLTQATLRMNMSGVPNERISFVYDMKRKNGTTASAFNNFACLQENCRVFTPSGGGIAPLTFQSAGIELTGYPNTATMPGYFEFYLMQWPQAGTSANDVAVRISSLHPQICETIDSKLKTSGPTITGTYVAVAGSINYDAAAITCATNCDAMGMSNILTSIELWNGNEPTCTVWALALKR